MKRPGPVGLLIVLAFSVPLVIELRTLLAMVGIHVDAAVYYPAALFVMATLVALALLLPAGESQGNLHKAG